MYICVRLNPLPLKKKEQKGCDKCSQYACAGDFSPHLHLTEHLNTNTSHKHLNITNFTASLNKF